MAPHAAVVAHGGLAGAIAESALVLVIGAVFIAVWLRERKAGRERTPGAAQLRDEDET